MCFIKELSLGAKESKSKETGNHIIELSAKINKMFTSNLWDSIWPQTSLSRSFTLNIQNIWLAYSY